MNFVKSTATNTTTTRSPSPEPQQVTTDLSKYGMGAQMLLAMGYKPGTGLGASGEGISAPIETDVRPQGMGIGAKIADKVESVDGKKDTSTTDPLLRQVYNLIEELQLKDVEVPTVPQAELGTIYNKLLFINTSIDEIDRQRKQLFYINRQLQEKLTSNQKQVVQITELAEAMKSGDMSRVLSVSINDNAPRTFVNCVSERFQEIIRNRSTDELVELSKMYQQVSGESVGTETEVSELNPFDSVIFKQLKLNLVDDASSNIDMLSYWYRFPIIINNFTLTYLVRRELIPRVTASINEWDSLDNSPLYLIDYLQLSNEFSPLVKVVYNKIVQFMSKFAPDQMAANLESLYIWIEMFQQYNHDVTKLNHVLFESILDYLSIDHTNWLYPLPDSLYTVITSQLMDSNQTEIIIQFKILNPQLQQLIHQKQTNFKQFLLNFKKWYVSIKRIVQYHSELTIIYNWYVNRILQPFENGKLPSLFSKSIPSNDEILKYFHQNVQGIPTTGLVTTFMDIMERYCIDHNIIMTKKQQDYEFNHRLRGVVRDDVLYIKKDDKYEPIELQMLAGLVNQ